MYILHLTPKCPMSFVASFRSARSTITYYQNKATIDFVKCYLTILKHREAPIFAHKR